MWLPFDSQPGSNNSAKQGRRVAERRRHPRLPFYSPVTICWTECAHPIVLQARLIDASESGMAVKSGSPVAAGTRLWILLDDGTDGCGEVCYCDSATQGFRIGLKFIAERRSDPLADHQHQHVLEWIDASTRLVGSFVSICGTSAGRIEMIAPEVVPCPEIVMLSGNQRRLLCCTRDWRPEQDSYRVHAELIREIVPTPPDSPMLREAAEAGDPQKQL
jgi:hypothetical protein